MTHHRSFSFDKIKNKVTGRRSLESSILEIASSGNARRNSVSNPMIVIQEESHKNLAVASRNRIRAQSLSLLHGNTNATSTSRSRSVKKMHTKALIKQETASVIQKKLLLVLIDLGIQNPISLETNSGGSRGPTSKTTKIYVANSSDCIYLDPATSASFTYEDVENGNLARYDYDTNEDTTTTPQNIFEEDLLSSGDERTRSVPLPLREKINLFKSPNYLCSEIDSEGPKPHTFAVIVELHKDMVIKELKVDFRSVVNLLWPSGDPYNKTYTRERYDIGVLEWVSNLNDCDYYISTENTNDIKSKNITTEDLAKRTREYKLIQIQDPTSKNPSMPKLSSSAVEIDPNSSKNSEGTSENCKAGLYVFLLPILIPGNVPATINSINGCLNHILNIELFKISDKLNRKVKTNACYNLPMVRTPPSFANSIADKPIYVNRVWNDSLHYIITFPKKYVTLGNDHLINLKLVPLVKDVIIKRIKFNVLERITYVSKNLTREFEYDSEDPYLLRSNSENKVRERIVPIYELTTKSKTSSNHTEPYKEEVIVCPDNNLLFSCYESEMDYTLNSNCDPLSKPDRDTMIATPLDINISLPLLTTKVDKTLLSSSVVDDHNDITQEYVIDPSSRGSVSSTNPPNFEASPRNSSGEGFPAANEINLWDEDNMYVPDHSVLLEPPHNNHHNHNLKDPSQQGCTVLSKALYPDSNFRHIQICHRLQVCFRISKKDPNDGYKMHHYEVVVDTPLILLSSKCYDASIQLPKYNEISDAGPTIDAPGDSISFRTPVYNGNGVSIKPLTDEGEQLPSFEEATSPLSSPVTRAISVDENNISRFPSISGPAFPNEPAPAYDFSEECLYSGIQNQLNIDEVVTSDQEPVDPHTPIPTIRQSLLNSFANVSSSSSSDEDIRSGSSVINESPNEESLSGLPDNITESASSKNDTDSSTSLSGLSSAPLASSETNIMRSSSGSSDSYRPSTLASVLEGNLDDAYSNDVFLGPLNESDLACDEEKISPIIDDKIKSAKLMLIADKKTVIEKNVPSKDGVDQESLYSQETNNFAQRLPLLENYSIDCITTQSISNVGRSKDDVSVITDGLVNQAQDYYRAF